MVAGCANKCIKYFFWFINFLFFVLGGIVCGFALWIRFDNAFQNTVLKYINPSASNLSLDSFYMALYVVAAIGLILFILGFLGCCGSCCESACVLGVYFTLVLALFAILLAGGIYILINKSGMQQQFINVWRNEFVNNYNTVAPPVRENIDNIHQQLQCCGATGCQDFTVPPASCNCTNFAGIYVRRGCATYIWGLIDTNFTIVIIVAAAILVAEAMVAGSGNKCIKYSFYTVNFFFFVLGGGIVGLTLWIIFDNTLQTTIVGSISPGMDTSLFFILLYSSAAIGAILFVLGFLGCCGSCCESACVIGLYILLTLALFVLLLAGGVYLLINKSNVEKGFAETWKMAFVDKYSTLAPADKQRIDTLHAQLQCCGAKGCSDFTLPPDSCNCNNTTEIAERRGCATYIWSVIDNESVIFYSVLGGILLVELFAIIFAIVMCRVVKANT